MRIYQNAYEMIKEVERDLAEMGIEYQTYSVQDQIVKDDPDYLTRELIAYGYQLTSIDGLEEMLSYKKGLDYADWVLAEANDRLIPKGQHNPGTAWELRRSFWEPFLRDGKFSYTYVERWQEQIDYVVKELMQVPESRQVVMTMYDRHQDMMNWRGRDRVPCSLTYHFLIREGKLHLIYSQRSCDFIKFFQADVYCTIKLMERVMYFTDTQMGSFTHVVNSLHAFKKDLEGVF